MRTRIVAAAMSFLVLLSAVTMSAGSSRADERQSGTPAPGGSSGISTEMLGQSQPADAPGQTLFLLRVTFAPGSSITAHTHPGTTIYFLASGSLQFTLVSGLARMTRAGTGGDAAATPAAAEMIPVGEEITLSAGDTVSYDGDAVQTERNTEDEPAVVFVSNFRGTGVLARDFVD